MLGAATIELRKFGLWLKRHQPCRLHARRHLWRAFISSDAKHKLDAKHDDIQSPKPSGYRGVHLI